MCGGNKHRSLKSEAKVGGPSVGEEGAREEEKEPKTGGSKEAEHERKKGE